VSAVSVMPKILQKEMLPHVSWQRLRSRRRTSLDYDPSLTLSGT